MAVAGNMNLIYVCFRTSIPGCNICLVGVRGENRCMEVRKQSKSKHLFRLAGMDVDDYGKRFVSALWLDLFHRKVWQRQNIGKFVFNKILVSLSLTKYW